MNIFIIEGNKNIVDWKKSAQSHDNRRLNKMITEHCQILSTALNVHAGRQIAPYKCFNPKHPSCLWATESSNNFEQLIEFTEYLFEERAWRIQNSYFKKASPTHKCQPILAKIKELYDKQMFPCHSETPFRSAINVSECIVPNDPILSYQKFWAQKPNFIYPIERIPEWFVELRGNVDFTIVEKF